MTGELIGYCINHPGGLRGTNGLAYDYILARDGVYIQCEGPLLRARIRTAEADIRGLEMVSEKIELVHGPIPGFFFKLAVDSMLAMPEKELFVAVKWDGEAYRLLVPNQERHGASVTYVPVQGAVLELHSHGRMPAFFSGTDDRDEQGFKIYAVCGNFDKLQPVLNMRVGVYGYWAPVSWPEIFDGLPPADVDVGGARSADPGEQLPLKQP